MCEHMRHLGQSLAAAGPGRCVGQQRRHIGPLRQAPQPCPHARGRALHEPAALALHQPQQRMRALVSFELARLHRVALRLALRACHALARDGALRAQRRTRQAQRGAEVHQALRVARHVVLRQQLLRLLPQRAFLRGHGQVPVKAEHAREHALDVAVEDGGALVEAERGNRRRRGAADARQLDELGAAAREAPPMRLHHGLRAAVQVACAAVVAQAAPGSKHVIQRRRSE